MHHMLAETQYEGFIGWVLALMESLGEAGVGLAVLIETFVPVIPSEAVLPGAGFLAYEGRMNFWIAWLSATIGAVVGAWFWYWLGLAFGRARTRWLVGKIPLMDHGDFDAAERFFTRWGGLAVLSGRCVPMVRSFISIPAGIERMPFLIFTLYTCIGSAVWNGLWIGLGFIFGEAIEPVLVRWSGALSNLVVLIAIALIVWFVGARVIRNMQRRNTTEEPSGE